MSLTKSYSPLRTLEEEEPEDDLELGPVRKVRYTKRGGAKNRYHGLFQQYDLESSVGESRNLGGGIWGKTGSRKGICLALAMAIVLITLIITAVAYVSSGPTSQEDVSYPLESKIPTGNQDVKPGVTLEEILSGKFYPGGFNGTWISDTEIKYFNKNGDLLLYDVTSKTSSLFVSGYDISRHLDGKPPIRCTISPDRNFLLLSYDAQKVFRHSTFSKYGVLDISTRNFHSLVPATVQNKGPKLLQFAQWGPVNNSLVFIYLNNVYYKPSALDTESFQITNDDSQSVYNGVTDWVYEEEVFNSDSAVWFSPDGSHLAFITFNDTLVAEIHFEIYGEPGASGYQYPVIDSIPYPKAGGTNPTAEVTMVALPGPKTGLKSFVKKALQFPGIPSEHYIYGVIWASAAEVLVITLNRHQNDSRHHLCTLNGVCEPVLVNQQQKGWIDVEQPKVSSDGNSFLTLTSQNQGDKWYRHILKYSKDSISKSMTSGQFSVDSILKWDEDNHRIYFLAPHYHATINKAHPSSTHLYYVDDSGTNSSDIHCVTCHSVNTHKETCDANSVEISKGAASYFVQSCAGPGVPEVFIKTLKPIPEEDTVWMDNADLRIKIMEISWPTIKNFDIPIENNLSIKARIEIPPNFDPSKKYPLLVDVYAGPTSQKITDNFHVDWSDYLITSKDVIYAYIDGRGSGRQSDDLKFQVYRRLGTTEIEDQIRGAEWLTTHVPFIDSNRTAIWGWSYGGFATAMALAQDTKGIFKCGISVAPVTNWQFYDTIYTERYMGLPTPDDNLAGYNESDITNHVENFRHKKFFLVHGTADDNVHYQVRNYYSNNHGLSDDAINGFIQSSGKG